MFVYIHAYIYIFICIHKHVLLCITTIKEKQSRRCWRKEKKRENVLIILYVQTLKKAGETV